MEVRPHTDPRRFLADATPLLEHNEARHNLLLGLAGTLVAHPFMYSSFHLWVVKDHDEVVAAALRTPPYPLTLASPDEDRAPVVLAAGIHAAGMRLPGVSGPEPEVDRFAHGWASLTGAVPVRQRHEGIYALSHVREISTAPGASRPADDRDRPLLRAWLAEFAQEALPFESQEPERMDRVLGQRLGGGDDVGLWLWEHHGEPVSMAGFAGPTPNGMRVGPVYTPRALRGRGYATALVSEMSAWLLAHGRLCCFLYTDLANPTSNAIYRRIGYEQVCDAASIRFAPAES